jgi:tetratricopeptide (TPR) repeat protein
MRRPLVFFTLLALAACHGSDQSDSAAEWQRVLHWKKAATSPKASAGDKQVYADTVAAFALKHPSHNRGQEVYHRLQLEFGEDLAAIGRYQDAIRFYQSVLKADPANLRAQQDVTAAVDRLAVSKEKLLKLEKGMSQSQVAQVLGKPIPGWTARNQRRDAVTEAWYYRKTDGGVAGVYFRDGELFAAEENSHAKLAPLIR